jgi:penicillin amidase
MEENNIFWFDNISTKNIESRDFILFKSFRDAVRLLYELYKTDDISQWKYGKLHTLILKHPLSANSMLDKSLSIGPMECSGNNTTINCASYCIFKPFDVNVGSSARFIADMSSNFVYTIIPGGSSGNISDMNYGSQVQLWLNGGYMALPIDKTVSPGFVIKTDLVPEN